MLELDAYQRNLAGLLLVCGTLLATGSGETSRKSGAQDEKRRRHDAPPRASQWAFYVVYALVMASDWLQVRTLSPSALRPQRLTPAPGPLPLLPLPGRARRSPKPHPNALHNRLPRRRPLRHRHRLAGRPLRATPSLPLLLPRLRPLVRPHRNPEPPRPVRGPGPRRGWHEPALQRVRELDGGGLSRAAP